MLHKVCEDIRNILMQTLKQNGLSVSALEILVFKGHRAPVS